ncbi:MAG TPA: GNAT family protein [Coriobacteriia bacterium]
MPDKDGPRGRYVYLTPFDPANLETVRAWVNDPETHRWMLSGQEHVSVEEELAFYDETERARAEGTAYRFEIHALDDGRLLGVCGLEHVSERHRHAEVGLFIGCAEERGRGFGADAIRALLEHGFGALGLHSIRITVFAENERAHALYRRLGFVETGRDRESWLISGALRDLVRLDMLEDEWRALCGDAAT